MNRKNIEQVLKEHSERLMALPGVVGTAQGERNGEAYIAVFVASASASLQAQLPSEIEGCAVSIVETGEIRAFGSG